MTRQRLETIVRDAGGEIKGNTITVIDDNLQERSPSFIFSSLDTVAHDMVVYALNPPDGLNDVIVDGLTHKWDKAPSMWSQSERNAYEYSLDLQASWWKRIALEIAYVVLKEAKDK